METARAAAASSAASVATSTTPAKGDVVPAPVTGERERLSRKRPAAAGLPSLALHLAPLPLSRPPLLPLHPDDEEADALKRQRYESGSSSSQSSQSSVSSFSVESSSQPPDSGFFSASSAFSPPSSLHGISDARAELHDFSSVSPADEPSGSNGGTGKRLCPSHPIHPDYLINSQVTILQQSGDARARILIGTRNQGRGHLLESGSKVGPYEMVGSGKDCLARHEVTHDVVRAQVISRSEMESMQKMVERLEQARELCSPTDFDVIQMAELLMPMTCEVVEEEESGRCVYFSPIHHGNLHDYMLKRSGQTMGLPEEDVARIFTQLARILAFCHQLGIMVRDLKTRKFVFVDEECSQLRLLDVFDVRLCENPVHDIVNEKFGSPAYVPPEVLSADREGFAGRPADVWGLGVLTYLLITGKYPFFDNTPKGVFERIKKARVLFPPSMRYAVCARALIYSLLRRCPRQRPTAMELTSFKWTPIDPRRPFAALLVDHLTNPTFTQRPTITQHIRELAMNMRQFPLEAMDDQVVPVYRRLSDNFLWNAMARARQQRTPPLQRADGLPPQPIDSLMDSIARNYHSSRPSRTERPDSQSSVASPLSSPPHPSTLDDVHDRHAMAETTSATSTIFRPFSLARELASMPEAERMPDPLLSLGL